MSHSDSDNLDRAAELQDAWNKKGLAEVRKALDAQRHPDFDGVHCLECGDDMPPLRLEMERIRCAPCEDATQKRNRLYR